MTTPSAFLDRPTALTEDGPSVLALLNPLLRERRTIARVAVGLAIIVVVFNLTLPRAFTSTSAFMPQVRKSPSDISGLAAQFGLSVPAGESGQSPAFYSYLLQSRALLGQVAVSPIRAQQDGQAFSGDLIRYWKIDKGSDLANREEAVARLKRIVTARVNARTGIVELIVTSSSANLAFQVNARLLALINDFNLRTLQSQAGAERRFTEARLKAVEADLLRAEARVRSFLQQNRSFQGSPALALEHERLQREARRQEELFTTLLQAFEKAKIEEIRNTPVVTVVEAPELAARPVRRGLARMGLLALLAGGILGALIAFVRDGTRRPTGPVSLVEQFEAGRADLGADLKRPWRLLIGR